MPMVDTSVAVATPFTTAVRITNGSAMAGSAITRLRTISPRVARRTPHAGEILVPIAEPHNHAQRQHDGREQPVREERGNRHAGDGPDRDQHEARRNRLGLRTGGREPRDQFALLRAARLHAGEEDGRHCRHVGRLRSGDAGHQVHRSDEHVREPAAHVPEQVAQERDHRARHAVISISRPRNTKSGTDSRMKCDMPSSMRPTTTGIGTLVVSDR